MERLAARIAEDDVKGNRSVREILAAGSECGILGEIQTVDLVPAQERNGAGR